MPDIQCFLVVPVEGGYQRQDGTGPILENEWEFGPGAMWYDEFRERQLIKDPTGWETRLRRGPDGKFLTVLLPDGTSWCIDEHATNDPNGFWTREGEPPNVTARPSIQTPRYHGHLVNGILQDD